VLALEPGNLEALSHLSFEKRHVADWRDLRTDVERIEAELAGQPMGLARVCAAFGLLSLPIDPALQLVAARAESLACAAGVEALPPPAGPSAVCGRVVLGFLSYDFREHPVSQLLVELFERIDRTRFEVVLLSTGPDDASALRYRVRACADRFVELRGLSDHEAALCIRSERVELLFDLMGHTRGHRMGILARRPAPLQVAYLGYPGSTGAPFIDYLIGDPLVTPLELAPLYGEKLAQMPRTFQPNGRWRPLPQPMTRTAAGLPESAFVMCAFNHTYKILPPAFDVWCAVLRKVPHAVLWLKEPNAQLHENVRREAALRGVDPGRILFAKAVPYAEHFSRLALADLFVDTWPYNAHTTAADALWAGVPVVTVHGNGFASRVAASVLDAAGIAELAFASVEDYQLAICALAHDRPLLDSYRDHLRSQRMALPLFDCRRYVTEFGDLLERMVARWRAGLPPEHLPAAPTLIGD
jgi:predicted O-linked N-acetylglucosamine transferase (SPINDLY family)